MAALLSEAQSHLAEWSGKSEAMMEGQENLEAELCERWKHALANINSAIVRDDDEVTKLCERWGEGTTTDMFVEAAANKELLARVRKCDKRSDNAIEEATAEIKRILLWTGQQRALRTLTPVAEKALEEERVAVAALVEGHEAAKAPIAESWKILHENHFQGLHAGVTMLECVIAAMVHTVLQKRYEVWEAEQRVQADFEREKAEAKSSLKKAKAKEQADRAKAKADEERARKAAETNREKMEATMLAEAKETGARLIKEKEEAAEELRVNQEEEARQAKEEALRKKKLEREKRKKEERERKKLEEKACKAAEAAASAEVAPSEPAEVGPSEPAEPSLEPQTATNIPVPAAPAPPPSVAQLGPPPGFSDMMPLSDPMAGNTNEVAQLTQQLLRANECIMNMHQGAEAQRQHTLRVESELQATKLALVQAQQKVAQTEEALKQCRRERDGARFSLRNYEDAAGSVQSGRSQGREERGSNRARLQNSAEEHGDKAHSKNSGRDKTPNRRAKTPNRQTNTNEEGWTRQGGVGAKLRKQPVNPHVAEPEVGHGFEALAIADERVKFDVPEGAVSADSETAEIPGIARGPSGGRGFEARRTARRKYTIEQLRALAPKVAEHTDGKESSPSAVTETESKPMVA